MRLFQGLSAAFCAFLFTACELPVLTEGGIKEGVAILPVDDRCALPAFDANVKAGVTTYRYSGTTSAPYGFIEVLPAGYSATPEGCKWPVVLMLHGSGESGNGASGNLERVAVHGPNKRITQGRHFPAIVITPQSPGSWSASTLDSLVGYIYANYKADPNRLYVTGLSMGGGGTWNYARAYPRRVAAIMPICGAAGTNNSEGERQALNDFPIWAFHSIGDPTVGSGNTDGFLNNWAKLFGAKNNARDGYQAGRDMTGHLNRNTQLWEWGNGRTNLNGSGQAYELDVHYTMYPDSSHDSWTRTYADDNVWKWLFSKKR